jgi:hypothetical protein
VRERPASLLLSMTARFLLELKDSILEELSVLDIQVIGKTARGREGEL